MKNSKVILASVVVFLILICLAFFSGPDQARAQTTFTNKNVSVVLPPGWRAKNYGDNISMAPPKLHFMFGLSVTKANGGTTEQIIEESYQQFSDVFKKVEKHMEGPNWVFEMEDEPDEDGEGLVRMLISPVHSNYFVSMMMSNYQKPGDYSVYETDEIRGIINSLKSSDPDEQSSIENFRKLNPLLKNGG